MDNQSQPLVDNGDMAGVVSEGFTAEETKAIENMSDDEVLEVFVRGLIIQKGLGDMEPEIFEGLVEDLSTRAVAAINLAILKALPADKRAEAKALADDDAEGMAKIIEESGINTAEITGDAMAKFAEIYLGGEK